MGVMGLKVSLHRYGGHRLRLYSITAGAGVMQSTAAHIMATKAEKESTTHLASPYLNFIPHTPPANGTVQPTVQGEPSLRSLWKSSQGTAEVRFTNAASTSQSSQR